MSNRLLVAGLAAGMLGPSVLCRPAVLFGAARPAVHALDADKDNDKDKDEKDEQKVPVDQIPQAVVDAVKKELPDGTITEAEKQKKHDKVIYEMDVKSGKIVYEVKISEDGTFISKAVDDDQDQPSEKK
jgi:uncharacterized membrane protein YkoI